MYTEIARSIHHHVSKKFIAISVLWARGLIIARSARAGRLPDDGDMAFTNGLPLLPHVRSSNLARSDPRDDARKQLIGHAEFDALRDEITEFGILDLIEFQGGETRHYSAASPWRDSGVSP